MIDKNSSQYFNPLFLNKSVVLTTVHRLHASNSSNSNVTSSPVNLLPFSTFDYIQACLFATTFFVSLLANGILLITTWKKMANSTGGWLLFHLVLVNFFQTVTVLPWDFVFFMNRNTDPFSSSAPWQNAGRNLISFILDSCTRLSWTLVALISVDRFCAIVLTKDFMRKRAKSIFWLVFIINFVATITPLAAQYDAVFHPWRHFCTIQRHGMYGYFVIDLLFFGIPCIVMVHCWGRMFALAWSKRLKVRLGHIAQPGAEVQTTAQLADKPNAGGNPAVAVLAFLSRATSKESISSSGSSSAPTSRKPSATTFVYNRTFKALRTVSVIVGSFTLTAGLYTVSLLLEVFENQLHTLQPWWFYGVADCAMFASSAIYPFTYGFLNQSVRRDVYVTVRGLFGYGPVPTPPLQRRWSLSSHIMDFCLPAVIVHSRRTSVDAVGPHGRRKSSTSEESDSVSETSIFHNFLKVRGSHRRQSAPSRLQHSVDSSGIVLTLPKPKVNNAEEEV